MKRKVTWYEIIWKSFNELMLIIGSIFIGSFFANPSLLNNYLIVYGVALIILSVISKIGAEKLKK